MTDDLKDIWAKVDARNGPQRMETEAEHIARDMREGNFPKRSDPIQVPVTPPSGMTDANIREIWMPPLWEVGDGTIPTSAQCEDDDIRYILATPEALAASPEVQALRREAEARVMRIAAGLFPGGYDANFAKIEAAIRGDLP